MTVEPTPTLSAEDAYRLTQRIRTATSGAREAMETLSVLVEEARAGGAHAAMGFASWTDYLSSTLGASPMRLDREQRRELVAYLAGEGMSTRAIAPIVGVGDSTVQRDLATAPSGAVARPSTVTSLDGRQRPSVQPARPQPAAKPEPSRAAQAVETYPELQHYRARHAHAAGAHHGRGVPVSDPQVHESIDGQPVGGAFALLSGATRPSECRSTSIAPTPRSPGHSPSGERGVRAPGVPAPCRTHKASGPARQLPTITRGTAQPNKEDIHVQSYRH